MIDFRVNEIRNLPDNINRYVSDNFLLKKVHFFIIREIDSEYVMANTNYERCRLLEGELWKKYLQTNKLHSIQKIPKMLIFHWKQAPKNSEENNNSNENDKKIANFAAFAKFSYRRQSWFIISRSLLIAAILSILANFASDALGKITIIRQYVSGESETGNSCSPTSTANSTNNAVSVQKKG